MLSPLPPDPRKAPDHLDGTVERVTFHSEETGFCVLRVKCKGHRDLVAVVGNLPQVVPGETIQADGTWQVNPQHGRQFKAEHLKTLPPDSIEGIEKYLASGLVKGIGPVYAGKLVAHFGKRIFDVIEHSSALLEQVEGIGRIRRLRIKESWNETRAVRAIMAFLIANGVSTARAFRIYKTYGDEAIQRVQSDPYCLCRDIRGIGFKTADQIAAHLGFEPTCELRARAGIEYVLHELTNEGHCAVPREHLIQQAIDILEIPEPIVAEALRHGIETRRLIPWDDARGERLVYPANLYEAETLLARRLHELASAPHPCPPLDEAAAIAWSEERIGLELAPTQRQAIHAALTSKVLVITGGPGVGKTTIINAIIRIFMAKKLRVQLCAPTGRAAKRMSETTGRPAKTIHRMLAFDASNGTFRHNEQHPLEGDVFVVDESSMLDLQLAWHFIRSIPRQGALLLVGDVNQLPSVGPGSVLADIIRADVFPVCRLHEVFRQAARSDIILNAHRINAGEPPCLKQKGEPTDFFFAEAEEPELALDKIVRIIAEALPHKFGFDPVHDIQLLTPMRRGLLGAQNLNQALQTRLNPGERFVERFGVQFRPGDKVMQIENNYDKDIYNGDIGHITGIDETNRELTVSFDGLKVVYDFQELDELVPSYAITIHKSQGSEYPCVVIPIHTQHYIMLQRNLLYTAVTRGRRLVVLVGTRKALGIAIKRRDTHTRITRLAERLSLS